MTIKYPNTETGGHKAAEVSQPWDARQERHLPGLGPLPADGVVQFIEDRKAGLSYPEIALKRATTPQVVRYHLRKAIQRGITTAQEMRHREVKQPLRYSPEQYDTHWVQRVVKACVVSDSGCWIWQHQLTTGMGYGQTSYRGKNLTVHRKMYAITRRVVLTRKQYVLHTCDTPACCNPAHLELGDAHKNQKDCVDKGRNYEARRDHCERGHPFAGDNLIIRAGANGRPRRICRACEKWRASQPEYKAKALERQRRRRRRGEHDKQRAA